MLLARWDRGGMLNKIGFETKLTSCRSDEVVPIQSSVPDTESLMSARPGDNSFEAKYKAILICHHQMRSALPKYVPEQLRHS